MAVDPEAAGRGLGTRLLASGTAEFERRGVRAAKVVISAGNARTLRLHERCGFVPRATITLHEGTASEVLVWSSP
jgi:L-amino acid N-acyltransferase YncA